MRCKSHSVKASLGLMLFSLTFAQFRIVGHQLKRCRHIYQFLIKNELIQNKNDCNVV